MNNNKKEAMKIVVQIENKRQYLLDFHDTVARHFYRVLANTGQKNQKER